MIIQRFSLRAALAAAIALASACADGTQNTGVASKIGEPTSPPLLPSAALAPGSVGRRRVMPPDVAARAKTLRASAEYQTAVARLARVTARGALAVAVTTGEMPSGVNAIVMLGQAGRDRRYVIINASALNDPLYDRARAAALMYEMTHEDDDTPVTLTLHLNGTIEQRSAKYGSRTIRARLDGYHADKKRMTGSLLAGAAATDSVDVPHFGRSMILRPHAEADTLQ